MSSQRFFGEDEIRVFPRAATRQISARGFVVCPLPLLAPATDSSGWVHDIYRLAYEQAKASLLPPWHERNLVASLN